MSIKTWMGDGSPRICAACGMTKDICAFPKRVRRHGRLENCKDCNRELRNADRKSIFELRLKRTDVDKFMVMRNHDSTAANRYEAPGYYSVVELIALFEKYDFKCAYCGGDAECRDHVVPFYRGGTNWLWNIVPCCNRCNNRKGAGTLESFVERYFPNTTLDGFMEARGITLAPDGGQNIYIIKTKTLPATCPSMY